jgi:hypothetical protein
MNHANGFQRKNPAAQRILPQINDLNKSERVLREPSSTALFVTRLVDWECAPTNRSYLSMPPKISAYSIHKVVYYFYFMTVKYNLAFFVKSFSFFASSV